jgi:hypothetical protein
MADESKAPAPAPAPAPKVDPRKPVKADKPKKNDSNRERKGGARKGGWGKVGDEDSFSPVKKGDPNYEEQDPESDVVGEWVVSPPSVEGFKALLPAILDEFWVAGDVWEVYQRLVDNNCFTAELEPEFVKRSMMVALGRKQRDRENLSSMFSEFVHEQVLTVGGCETGFGLLLKNDEYLADLLLDNPGGIKMLSQFVARTLQDKVITEKVLDGHVGPLHGIEIVAGARVALEQTDSASRIAKIWGPGDGRPVEELKKSIALILGEYLIGGDLSEATRCVRELDSRFYLHELVKQAVVATVDKKDSGGPSKTMALVTALEGDGLISSVQIEQGFEKVLDRAEDLQLDVPDFLATLKESFVAPATEAGHIPENFASRCVPMSEVKPKIDSMVAEYFDTGDAAEGTRCLADLGELGQAPHVHAEVVRRLCSKGMERSEKEQRLASALVYHWRHTDTMTAKAVQAGFERLLRSLGDLVHDVPCAFMYMSDYVSRAAHDGLLPDGWLDEQLKGS